MRDQNQVKIKCPSYHDFEGGNGKLAMRCYEVGPGVAVLRVVIAISLIFTMFLTSSLFPVVKCL